MSRSWKWLLKSALIQLDMLQTNMHEYFFGYTTEICVNIFLFSRIERFGFHLMTFRTLKGAKSCVNVARFVVFSAWSALTDESFGESWYVIHTKTQNLRQRKETTCRTKSLESVEDHHALAVLILWASTPFRSTKMIFYGYVPHHRKNLRTRAGLNPVPTFLASCKILRLQ